MAGEFVAGGRAVAAARGWDWIAAGWELFKKQAGMWIALLIVFLVVMVVIAVIPILGTIASTVLTPVFGAGLFVAARAVDEGRGLEIGHLFAGFREKFATLALVGVIYLGAAIMIALVVGIASGVGILAILAGTAAVPDLTVPAVALTFVLAVLIMLGLLLPVIMAIWFAPALVLFHGKGAVQSMQESFLGCLRNIVPFVVYGLVSLVFSMLASVPFGLGWLVFGPVLAASIYTSYKDIFIAA